MELMQLEMFVAVYEERSFRRAAERVYRTQPAVSLALARLEEEAGARLLERERGQREEIRLTKVGELVYEYASRMIGLRNEIASVLHPAKIRPAECLRLGVSEGWPARWAARLIGTFRRGHPHVRVEAWYGASEALVREVRERKIDLAILEAVPQLVHGNMEVMWIPAALRAGDSGQARTAWLLQHRTGRSYASMEFEQEVSSFVSDHPEIARSRKERKVAEFGKRLPRETTLGRMEKVVGLME